ncbi:MAG: Fic/DOC family protein [Alphaproteobacteria bacterium]
MTDPVYCYPPDFTVPRNRLHIRDAELLDSTERMLVIQRAEEGVPLGDFDLAHLQAIHRHLFQDVYDWAGEIRIVELSKGGSQFQPVRFIATGMADVHRRIVAADRLRGMAPADFAAEAGRIMGDVNHVHPFREGNGRAQLLYLQRLAAQAGHRLDLTRLDRVTWTAASAQAQIGNYEHLGACILQALVA